MLCLQSRPEEDQEAGKQTEVHLHVLRAGCERQEEPLPAYRSEVGAESVLGCSRRPRRPQTAISMRDRMAVRVGVALQPAGCCDSSQTQLGYRGSRAECCACRDLFRCRPGTCQVAKQP